MDIDYSYGHIMATAITKVYGHKMYLVQIHCGCSSQQFYGLSFLVTRPVRIDKETLLETSNYI